MPIEHINKTDTLNEGREKLNNAITAFNETVVEGDSSVEAAQARVDEKGVTHPTLKARIDDGFNSVNTDLAHIQLQKANRNEVFLKNSGININDFDEPTRQTFLEQNGIDVNYVLGYGNVAPENTTFFIIGKNKFDKNSALHNFRVNINDGEVIETAEPYAVSRFIAVDPNTPYSRTGGAFMAFYDSQMNFIQGFPNSSESTKFTTTENTRFIRVTLNISQLDFYQVEVGGELTDFEPYEVLINPKYSPLNKYMKQQDAPWGGM